MNDTNEIIRPRQLCRMLSISIPTLYRWESIGQVPIKKVRIGPNVVGYRRTDVERWMSGETKDPGTGR